jgi:hypothetical protein
MSDYELKVIYYVNLFSRKKWWKNIHLWLVLLNVVSLFFILQIVFELIPLWDSNFTVEKVERINSFIVDLSLGIITSTFFYYLLVYIGERKRRKGVRRLIQWRLDAMAQNMEIVIGYYVYKCKIDCRDMKFLTAHPENFHQVPNPTRDVINYWFGWENGGETNVCGSTERGFVCYYIDLLMHHANRIMESTVFSLEDTTLMGLISKILRCGYVQHVNLMIVNPKMDMVLGDYGMAFAYFFKLYCELAEYSRIDGLIPMNSKEPHGIATICK